MTARDIAPATGKLGVLLPGLGAVASTFIAGVLQARQTGNAPIGSLSQMAHIRLGEREEDRNPLIKDFVPLASLDDLVFGGWDPISANALEAARTAGVLEERDLAPISAEMEGIVAMDAVFDQSVETLEVSGSFFIESRVSSRPARSCSSSWTSKLSSAHRSGKRACLIRHSSADVCRWYHCARISLTSSQPNPRPSRRVKLSGNQVSARTKNSTNHVSQ